MNDLNVIDQFLSDFSRYIDSGFGLIGGDVAFLSTTMIGIDITLAGLFWAMGGEDDIIGRLLKKILYVGAFALIIGNFATLADIIFRSFAGIGVRAGGGSMSPQDLLRPGHIAAVGFDAAWPMLEQVSDMMGFYSFFENFLTIVILLIAWLIVVIAFFVLAIQLFVTILEFKLTTLAGFVLVPFALWGRTAFLAERVLGNVVSSGIKVMVLAVIVGIGSGFFSQFVATAGEIDIAKACSLVLGSLSLLGLSIFGPGIASGLVSGAPQLGAGAAVSTGVAAGGTIAMGAAAVATGGRALAGGGMAAMRAGTTMGAGASTAYKLGQETSGSNSVGAGLKGVASAGAGAVKDKVGAARNKTSGVFGDAADRGRKAAFFAGSGRKDEAGETSGSGSGGGGGGSAANDERAPAWAQRLQAKQTGRQQRRAVLDAVSQGSSSGGGANPDIKDKED